MFPAFSKPSILIVQAEPGPGGTAGRLTTNRFGCTWVHLSSPDPPSRVSLVWGPVSGQPSSSTWDRGQASRMANTVGAAWAGSGLPAVYQTEPVRLSFW